MPAFEPPDGVIAIMAGGAGERFWPLSNRSTPKQLLRLHGGRTLLELAFERACALVPADRVLIVAGERLREAILAALPGLAESNYIAEPQARNTAACLGLAACVIEARYGPDAVMGVLTADHLIGDLELFRETAAAALMHAAASADLVTIGMQPERPETAYGYLELGESLPAPLPGKDIALLRVRRFTEKPEASAAAEFLARGNYLWNSGMFFWKVATLLRAFESHQPGMAKVWAHLRRGGEAGLGTREFAELFGALPSLPIDTAVMERATNVVAIRGRFTWEDVGSWDALARIGPGDAAGNRTFGAGAVYEAAGNLLYNEAGGAAAPEVILFGVEDLVVVRTGRVTLVMPKSRAQDMKQLLQFLKDRGRDDLL